MGQACRECKREQKKTGALHKEVRRLRKVLNRKLRENG
jgi:hypothetical protein